MKITEVLIENYKSIKKIHLKPMKGLNAFIGENSVGKSNIFDAINWLLGPVYPSFNSTRDEDRYLGDPDNKINIKITFDDQNYLEFAEEWTNYKGETKCGLNLNGNYIKDQDRRKYCSAYLGTDRQILDYLPSNRWSLIGRILQQINDKFCKELDDQGKPKSDKFKEELKRIRDDYLFSVKDENGGEPMKRFIEILQEESANQLNRKKEDLSLDFNLYDPWNFYRTLQILVKESDIGLEFQASNLGMGVQASISIAILKAYSEISIGSSTPIFIDEPELFLHPQAQRNFYNILKTLAKNGTQVFYTTHSPDFLSAGRFYEIFIVRKILDRGTTIFCGNLTKFILDLKKRKNIDTDANTLLTHYRNACDNTGDSQKANEAFFAKKIILVEGSSESLLLPYFFKLSKYGYIKEGITIVRCGCKQEIDRFYRLYSEFGIPCYSIFDGDKHLDGKKGGAENIETNKELMSLFGVQNPVDYPDGTAKDKYFAFEDEISVNLGVTECFGLKGLDLYIKTKDFIKSESDLPSWVSEIKTKIIDLNQSSVISVLQTT